MARPKRGLFIAGTNTEVGKTFVGSRIAESLTKQGVRVGVYKPVASGCRLADGEVVSDDAVELWEAASRPLDLDAVCPQRFLKAVAPHVAAQDEGRESDFDQMLAGLERWSDFEFVIVEGVGGLMSPIAQDWYTADLAVECKLPVLLVAANRLGVINDTLQSLITAMTFRDGLDVCGVVLNDVSKSAPEDPSYDSNWRELQSRCVPPCLCRVTHSCRKQESREINESDELSSVDWMKLAAGTIDAS